MEPVLIMAIAFASAWLGAWLYRRLFVKGRAGRVVVSARSSTGPRHGRRQRGFIRAERGKSGRGKASGQDRSKRPGKFQQAPKGPIKKPWGW